MKFLNYLVISIFFISVNSLYAAKESPWFDFVLKRLATSTSLQRFAQKKRSQAPPLDKNTEPELAALFDNSQKEVGIESDNLLPVAILSKEEVKDNQAYAYAGINAMNVIKENFNPLPYGAKRIIALHESLHHKYNDQTFQEWGTNQLVKTTFIMTALKSCLLAYVFSRYIQNAGLRRGSYILTPVLAFISSSVCFGPFINFVNSEKFICYKENRVDLQAVQIAQCYACVKEYQTISFDHDPEYLTKDELQVYIDRLQEQKCVCNHHSKES